MLVAASFCAHSIWVKLVATHVGGEEPPRSMPTRSSSARVLSPRPPGAATVGANDFTGPALG